MRWLLLIWLTLSPLPALAAEVLRAHAISMFDSETPRYPADFRHFDYVNPDAPKGGSLRLASQGSFCLLYTSPSPRDAHESRMPSSA